jgi:glycosyltransferase involved in cell wall biosynthesis
MVARFRSFLRFAGELRQVIAQADVVNCHHAVLALLLPGRTLITTYHGYRGRLNLRFGTRVGEAISVLVRRLLIGPALRKSRTVTLVSQSLYEEAARAKICEPLVIFNGTNLPNLGRTTVTKTHFLYVGRLDLDKNVAQLLRAYCNSGINVPLLVVGDGSERANLERLYKNEPVEFLGKLSQEALVGLYAAAYAFVTASTFETFCLPVIEAASIGCPSVGPRSGALPEVILDGETGYLVDDPECELAEILERIVSLGEDERAKIEAACRVWADRFGWEAIAAQYEQAYANIAKFGLTPAAPEAAGSSSPRSVSETG